MVPIVPVNIVVPAPVIHRVHIVATLRRVPVAAGILVYLWASDAARTIASGVMRVTIFVMQRRNSVVTLVAMVIVEIHPLVYHSAVTAILATFVWDVLKYTIAVISVAALTTWRNVIGMRVGCVVMTVAPIRVGLTLAQRDHVQGIQVSGGM